MSRASKFLLLSGGVAIAYAIRDQFTTDLAAGTVNNTNSEPGPGVRHVVDTTGTGVLITGSKIRIIGDGSFGHEGFYLTPAITRAAGLVVRMDFSSLTATHIGRLGLTTVQDAGFAGYNNVGIYQNGTSHLARRATDGTSPQISVDSFTSGSFYMVLRAAGRYILFDPLDGSDVQLWWWDNWDNTAALYLGAIAGANGQSIDIDNALAPLSQFFNIGALALASDSFNRADGALGSTDGAGHAEANGGSGLAWTDTIGTWAVATNKAASSALSGGKALATVDVGTKDVNISCGLTRAAGVVGIVLRYVDASNYLIVYHDGTNVKMDEVIAGTPTTRITAAATYSAGAALRIRMKNNTPATNRAVVHYNDLYVGTYITNAAALTGTKVGLYTTDTGATFDNFICFGLYGYNAIRVGS